MEHVLLTLWYTNSLSILSLAQYSSAHSRTVIVDFITSFWYISGLTGGPTTFVSTLLLVRPFAVMVDAGGIPTGDGGPIHGGSPRISLSLRQVPARFFSCLDAFHRLLLALSCSCHKRASMSESICVGPAYDIRLGISTPSTSSFIFPLYAGSSSGILHCVGSRRMYWETSIWKSKSCTVTLSVSVSQRACPRSSIRRTERVWCSWWFP